MGERLRSQHPPTDPPGVLRARAAAKINLALLVGARRDDGFHEVVSVMQAVGLWDDLEVAVAAHGFGLEVDGEGLPPDESNLVLEIGSDVPFCLSGGSQVGTGRGERLGAAPVKGTLWWVVAIDSDGLGTAPVYQHYDELGLARPLEDRWPSALLEALAAGDLERIGASLTNDLEPAAFDLHPALEAGKDKLLEAGAVGAVMSGSGPTLLALARDEEHAGQLAGAVRPAFARVEVARGPVPGVTFG